MSDEANITIVKYDDSMAQSVADMWNTWDDLWIGGFTQGVPYTPERVRNRLSTMRAIALLVAVDETTKKSVGYCSLMAHWRDKEASYVGILGVSPEVLGKKVGKRLLLRATQISIDHGYTRIDLGTWAGNLRAVPLYKKIGFMWNPEQSGVHLENYIPEILAHPLSNDFFELHTEPDAWYTFHKREVAQAPDSLVLDGMSVYEYNFADDENSLKIIVDRYSRSITGISREIAGKKLRVSATVNNHLNLCGVPSVYAIEIENGTDESIEVDFSIDGFDGLKFDSPTKHKERLESGQTLTHAVPFILESTVPIHIADLKTPFIHAKMKLNGQESSLRTGLKITPAAEIKTRAGPVRIAPGGLTSIPITILSQSSTDMSGNLVFEDVPKGLALSAVDSKVNIPAEGFAGATIDVTAHGDLEEGTYDLWAHLALTVKSLNGQVSLETRKWRIPVYCFDNGSIAIGEDDREKRTVITSDRTTAYFQREGGILRLVHPGHSLGSSYRFRTEIGPPFGISPFRFAERNASVSETDSAVTVKMTIDHSERPLHIEERAIFEKGSSIVTHEVWVTNTSKEPHRFQLRVYGSGGGISFSPGVATVPLASGITQEPIGNFMFGHPAIPNSPDYLSEGWLAIDNGQVTIGQVWDKSQKETIEVANGQIQTFDIPETTLAPGETRRISRILNIMNASNWMEIQNTWQIRIAKKFNDFSTPVDYDTPCEAVSVKPATIVVPHVEAISTKIEFKKTIAAPLGGMLQVVAPSGWDCKGEMSEKPESTSMIPLEAIDNDSKIPLELIPSDIVKDEFSIDHGSLRFTSAMVSEKPITLILLGRKESKVEISESIEEGKSVYTVDNGLCQFKVSPDFGGCMTSLKNSNSTELLLTAFPEASPKVFVDNYYGGVQAVLWSDDVSSEDLTRAHTAEEKRTAKIVEHGPWKGVEMSWSGIKQQTTRGLKMRQQYLTAPGSPLVLVRLTIKNPTTAPIVMIPTMFFDIGFNGSVDNVQIVAEWGARPSEIMPSPIPTVMVVDNNAIWARNGSEASEGVALLAPGQRPDIIGMLIQDFKLLAALYRDVWFGPGDEKTFTACLFVDPPDMDTIKQLQISLEKITEPL